MRVLEAGRKQAGWATQAKCSGNGNGGGGCGALLLVEQLDVYLTSRSDYTGDTDHFHTFKCCECGVETDLPNDIIPQCVRETCRPKRIMGDQRD